VEVGEEGTLGSFGSWGAEKLGDVRCKAGWPRVNSGTERANRRLQDRYMKLEVSKDVQIDML
jgi:hypothetical protein